MSLTPARGNLASIEFVGRGVSYAPFLRRGRPVLVVTTTANDLVAMKTLRPGMDVDTEIEKLEKLLDRRDPPLRIVK